MPNPREHVTLTSADPTAERIAALKALFPDACADGRIDFDKLRAALGDSVAGGPERFTFSWAGRADAAALLQTPSRATLVPKPKESVNWDATRNLFIEGDNLEVLKLLYKAYAGQVKLIYIDPPYNTGQDFVYPDNFSDPLAVYLQLTKQADAAGKLLTSNPETSGRYHSAWLSMMYPRLFLARQFLRDDGVIFVSIDDHEVHHLRMLMNEVFGEENWVGTIVWKGATDNNPTRIAIEHEYILCFGRDTDCLPGEWKNRTDRVKLLMLNQYEDLRRRFPEDNEKVQGEFRRFIKENRESLIPLTHYDRIDSGGPYTGSRKVHNPKPGGYMFDVPHPVTRRVCERPANGYRFPPETFKELLASGKILFGEDETQIVQIKEYLADYEAKLSGVLQFDSRTGSNQLKEIFQTSDKLFTNPKPVELIKELVSFLTTENDIIMDFFAGSGTTGQVVLELNHEDERTRQFVLVQFPESVENEQYPTIADIGKERIRRVIAKLGRETSDLTRTSAEDLGFKVFALAESHFEQWAGVPDRDASQYASVMDRYLDPIKPNADPVAVLWELAVKEGYRLNCTVSSAAVGPNTIFSVSDPEKDPPQSFRACLDEQLASDIARQLGLTINDMFICRDSALDDTLAANLALQCRLKTI